MENTRDYYRQQGAAIRNLRIAQGKTQKDVAEGCGMLPQQYSQIERGVVPLSSERLAKIVELLGGVVIIDAGQISIHRKTGAPSPA